MFDYHIHTRLSHDSEATPIEMAKAAEKAGLREICFTDHADSDPLQKQRFGFSDVEFIRNFECLKENYSRVKVRLGVEMGAVRGNRGSYDFLVNQTEYDFVICSTHYVWTEDPRKAEYYKKRKRKKAIQDYLSAVVAAVYTHTKFNVLGNIANICKLEEFPYKNRTASLLEFFDYYNVIFKTLIESGRGIEVNTSMFDKNGELMPSKDVIKRYYDLGGEIITVGSDAHTPGKVGYQINETLDLLKSIGFRYVCTFEKQEPIFNRIS